MSEKSISTFSEIYIDAFKEWPKKIDISDGEIVPKDHSDPEDKEGGYFPTLSKTWRQVESCFEGKIDWYELMVWTMFQLLHGAAVQQKRAGDSVLDVESILQKNLVEEKYFANLAEGGWYPDVPEKY
jgi:hypothetical protein